MWHWEVSIRVKQSLLNRRPTKVLGHEAPGRMAKTVTKRFHLQQTRDLCGKDLWRVRD
jgi:hypothetical protein